VKNLLQFDTHEYLEKNTPEDSKKTQNGLTNDILGSISTPINVRRHKNRPQRDPKDTIKGHESDPPKAQE